MTLSAVYSPERTPAERADAAMRLAGLGDLPGIRASLVAYYERIDREHAERMARVSRPPYQAWNGRGPVT